MLTEVARYEPRLPDTNRDCPMLAESYSQPIPNSPSSEEIKEILFLICFSTFFQILIKQNHTTLNFDNFSD